MSPRPYVYMDLMYRCPLCGATMQTMMTDHPDESTAKIACRNYRCPHLDIEYMTMRIRVEVEPWISPGSELNPS